LQPPSDYAPPPDHVVDDLAKFGAMNTGFMRDSGSILYDCPYCEVQQLNEVNFIQHIQDNLQMATSTTTETSTTSKAYIRLMRPDELESVVSVYKEAFLNDAMQYYFMGLKKPLKLEDKLSTFEAFQRFTLKACSRIGARTTVLIERSDDEKEEIVGAAIWLPPRKRLSALGIWGLLSSGILTLVWNFGFQFLTRAFQKFTDTAEKTFHEEFKNQNLGDPDDAWYLQLIGLLPSKQGKGYASLLMREVFDLDPNGIFTLDASSDKSTSRYAHVGFEIAREWYLGEGEVDKSGLPATGADASGLPVRSMIKHNPKSSPTSSAT